MASIYDNSFVTKIKIWLFPSLVMVLGWFLVTSITEMKSDIKLLLTQSSADRATIQALTKEVDLLNQKVFSQVDRPYPQSKSPVFIPAIAFVYKEEEDKKLKLKKI